LFGYVRGGTGSIEDPEHFTPYYITFSGPRHAERASEYQQLKREQFLMETYVAEDLA